MKKLLVGAAALISINATAQDTYQQVYSLFQANCTVGCHGNGGTSGNLDLYGGGDASVVYDNIVDVTPVNPTAASKGYKRIYPGHPEKSFLLRKCSYAAWDDYYPIEVSEGNAMPDNQPVLEKEEVELIRQWILYGAKETGTVVDPQLLYDYYHVNGKPRQATPPAPAEGEGFQLRMGPFFLAPQQEVEFFKKQDITLADSVDVDKLETWFNDESHHFIIYKFVDGTDADYPAGLRNINDPEGSSLGVNEMVATWQDAFAYNLPEETAFRWKGNQVLDMNYHIVNYDEDSIIAAESYTNIYTAPVDTNNIVMTSVLIPINAVEFILGTGTFGQDLIIPNDGELHTFTYRLAFPFYPQAPTWHIWSIQSHTHARGLDFDIYKSTANGQKGEQFYEGFYNRDYTFNQGFYDWEHPAVRFFEPFYEVPLTSGLIFEAVYQNFTADTIYWGNTTQDEMMLFYVQYTEEALPTSSVNEQSNPVSFISYPNPFTESTQIYVNLPSADRIQLDVFNMAGEKITTLADAQFDAGQHRFEFSSKALNLASGIYLARLNTLQGTQSIRMTVVD
ncbi:MAG: T9SS type A sorting domain-containing protein [Bacteroidia bacterium]